MTMLMMTTTLTMSHIAAMIVERHPLSEPIL